MLHRAKAPLRVSFAGGGTDVAPFPEREGGLVLSASINRYAYGALSPRGDAAISVESVDFGIREDYISGDEITLEGRLQLIKAAIRKFGRDDTPGFDLFLHSNAPPGSGLGSSSAVMVALIGLLKDFHGMPLTDYEIAELAYVVEREDVGIRGGLQDQYAATFGGINFIEFNGDHVVVNPLRIPGDVVHELEHNMLLCYTGRTRTADHIIDDQTRRFEAGEDDALEGLRMQKQLAVNMKNALLQRRLSEFGDLLGTAWRYKKLMSPHISTDFIDEAYELALRHGALGGKVTGAGGGGYMLFYCPFRRVVAESVRATEGLAAPEAIAFITACADGIVGSLREGGTAFLCGNGGSSADATHLAAELLGRFRIERSSLAAVSLADNVSALTAIGNDYGYEQTFSRQLAGLGRRGDVLIALSTSGTSANVLAAVDTARQKGLVTVGMTGQSGGGLAASCDLCLRVASSDTARIQEAHMVAGHAICELVERALVSGA